MEAAQGGAATSSHAMITVSPASPFPAWSEGEGQPTLATNHTSVRSKAMDIFKLVAVILPALAALAMISYLVFTQATQTMRDTQQMSNHLKTSETIIQLVHMLQRERGISCIYLGSNISNSDIMESVAVSRKAVDAAMATWFKVTDGVHAEQKQRFKKQLTTHRHHVSKRTLDCYTNVGYLCINYIRAYNQLTKSLSAGFSWFSSEIDKLLSEINAEFRTATDGRLWNTITSYILSLKAIELIGRKRAIGGLFFSKQMSSGDKGFQLFNNLQCGADHLLAQSYMSNPKAQQYMDELAAENIKLMDHLRELTNEVLIHNVTDQGSNKSLDWFYSMTTYIDLLSDVEAHTTQDLIHMLQVNQSSASFQYHMAIAVVTGALVVCSCLIGWYMYQARKMMKKIGDFTAQLEKKTKELKGEKQKTDMLLYQILPKSIATKLKMNKPVEPEHFDLVTVYFSDVMGFTTLAGKSTPLQVIELLNELYTRCDNLLDKYDVYKVETIGDAYMVASGLPKRIGEQHSCELATMALDINRMITEFEIPHQPSESLLLRIGIHTGPCVAGIVGTKMPRYCLFGDTVNTASRMESSGLALQVQLSEDTKTHLDTNFPGQFQTIERGKMEIKGKGEMTTYWLLGKNDFPFTISPEGAAEIVEKTTYWKN